MTLEIIPTIKCNLKCTYCYQDPMRNAGNFGTKIDLEKILPKLTQEFVVFGGEPLLVGKQQLETLWKVGLEKFNRNGIQTNGALIDDEFIALFHKYNVGVGLSVDGPGKLNRARCDDSTTATIIKNVYKLLASGIIPGIHVVLNKHNASAEALPTLIEWVKILDERGIREIRFHLLEEGTEESSKLALTKAEGEAAFLSLAKTKTKTVILQPFYDMKELLRNEHHQASCIFTGCDPLTTPAVQGLDGDGTLSNCGRINKDGVSFRKANSSHKMRLLALLHTPEQFGGCKDCRFFFACKGECPGSGENSDWRNRTQHCSALKVVWEYLEGEIGPEALSLRDQRINFERLESNGHGDAPHKDTPHGDLTYLKVPIGRPEGY